MNIETKWLEDFLSLANTRSFSKSAEERHVTQPAFSRRIRNLEQAVGSNLVDRSSTPVQLTPQGQVLRNSARNLMQQLNDTLAQIRGLSPYTEPSVDFAAAHSLAQNLYPLLVRRLHQELGEFATRLLAVNVDEGVQTLKEGGCDFLLGFCTPKLAPAKFASLTFSRTRMIPVSAVDEAGKAVFPLPGNEYEPVPYLAYSSDAYLGRQMTTFLQQHPPGFLHLRKVFETSMAENLKMMALQKMGVAWLPAFCVEQELARGELVQVGEVKHCLPLEVYLYRNKTSTRAGVEKIWAQLERWHENNSVIMPG